MAFPADMVGATAAQLKWAKWIIRGLAEGLTVVEPLFAYGHDQAPETIEWRRVQCVFTRATPTGTSEDKAVCTFDLVNITGGAVDTSWVTADYTTAEAKLDTFWNALVTGLSPKLTLSQYRWYKMRFTPPGTTGPKGPKAYVDSVLPERITTKSIIGTGTGTQQVPFQVAATVTEKTAIPKHWGRFYIPNPGITMFDAFGRIANPGFIATPAGAMYAALADAELYAVVPSAAHRSLLGVTQIQVDDVPDVQRRRRPKQPLQRIVAP
jgi:hypothetical protein